MAPTARILCGLLIILGLIQELPCHAQRIRFASETADSAGSSNSPYGSGVPSLAQNNSAYGAPASTYGGQPTYGNPSAANAAPSLMQPPAASSATGYPAQGYIPQTTTPAQSYSPQTYAGSPYASSTTVPAPATAGVASPYSPTLPPPMPATAAASPGLLQSPTASWDPYATPSPQANAPLMSQDPYFQSGAALPGSTMTKFMQKVKVDYDWIYRGGKSEKKLGVNDFDFAATFAFPFFNNIDTPFLITPGFGLQLWDGPSTIAPDYADLPPHTFAPYLDAAWNPQITAWLGAELDFRIGVYSDFDLVKSQSIRYTGTGLGVVTLSPNVKAKAGIVYLDRLRVKILPAGGIVWTPNPDVYFNILFPNPKIGRRFVNYGTTEWWGYAEAEYGGGSWTITHGDIPGSPFAGKSHSDRFDQFDYNDVRISFGLEFKTVRRMTGHFDIGVAFDRELRYKSDLPGVYKLDPALITTAGFAF